MNLKRANAAHVSEMQRLNLQLGYEVETVYLSDQLKKSSTIAFVAEEGGVLSGFVSGVVFDYTHCPFRTARLDALVVDETARRQGIGRLLIKKFEQEAATRGCKCIELSSHIRREKDGTYDFYESLGYLKAIDAETTYFRKRLA